MCINVVCACVCVCVGGGGGMCKYDDVSRRCLAIKLAKEHLKISELLLRSIAIRI